LAYSAGEWDYFPPTSSSKNTYVPFSLSNISKFFKFSKRE
jgi:hypothetical protein